MQNARVYKLLCFLVIVLCFIYYIVESNTLPAKIYNSMGQLRASNITYNETGIAEFDNFTSKLIGHTTVANLEMGYPDEKQPPTEQQNMLEFKSYLDFNQDFQTKLSANVSKNEIEELLFYTGVQQELDNTIRGSPFEHLSRYKNPCWVSYVSPADDFNPYRNGTDKVQSQKFLNQMTPLYRQRFNEQGFAWRIRCLPYFYILGITKCGTSDLFGRLGKHPLILKPRGKEHKFWEYYLSGAVIEKSKGNNNKRQKSLARYLDSFDGVGEEMRLSTDHSGKYHPAITMDGTPTTLTDHVCWHEHPMNYGLEEPKIIPAHIIKRFNPDAKLLVIMRNPVDRLYSHYKMMNDQLNKESRPDEFHSFVLDVSTRWHRCVRKSSLRSCAYEKYAFGHKDRQKTGSYFHSSMYSVYIRDWLDVFPRQQFYFLRTEDYGAHMSTVLGSVFDFLGVGQVTKKIMDEIINTPEKNTAEMKGRNAEDMWNDTRQILETFYEPFNQELADMLGDDRFLWR